MNAQDGLHSGRVGETDLDPALQQQGDTGAAIALVEEAVAALVLSFDAARGELAHALRRQRRLQIQIRAYGIFTH